MLNKCTTAFMLLGLALPTGAFAQETPEPVELKLEELDLTVSNDAASQDNFLYLGVPRFLLQADKDEVHVKSPSADLDGSGLLVSQGGAVDFVYLPSGVRDPRHGFALSVSSRVMRQSLPAFVPVDPLGAPRNEVAQEVGLSLGYQGFNLGATVSTDTSFLDQQVDGLNVGLGYAIGNFTTTLSAGQYRSDGDDAGYLSTQFDDFYKLELGASYRFGGLFRFSGGVQYLDFRNQLLFGKNLDGRKLFLRGSVTF